MRGGHLDVSAVRYCERRFPGMMSVVNIVFRITGARRRLLGGSLRIKAVAAIGLFLVYGIRMLNALAIPRQDTVQKRLCLLQGACSLLPPADEYPMFVCMWCCASCNAFSAIESYVVLRQLYFVLF